MPDKLTPRFDDITIFETEDGKARVEVRFGHDNVWLSQKLMAELYECSPDNISLHLKNIFKENELLIDSVTEESSVTAVDGKGWDCAPWCTALATLNVQNTTKTAINDK